MPEFFVSKFEGSVWRQTTLGVHPLDSRGSFDFGGRYNPPTLFQLLYTSLTVQGVKAEFFKFADLRGSVPSLLLPRELHQIRVSVEKVIDLTDRRNRKLLNCSIRDLTRKNWRTTQTIGEKLLGECDAILTYSAAATNETNLALYESGIRRASVMASIIIDNMSDWDVSI